MKKKEENKFKFELSQHVFIIGRKGRCIVTGRGKMDFVSGGALNMYQLSGGQCCILQETDLLSVDETMDILSAEACWREE